MNKKSSRNQHYNYLLNEFGIDRLKERQLYLIEAANSFIKDREIEDVINIDYTAINHLVIDYFADISRLKNFHKIKNVNSTKVAAYTTYWTYKRSPLSLKTNSKLYKELLKEKPYLNDINEWFCCFLFISMKYNMRKPILQEKESKFIEIWTMLFRDLNYYLTYRIVTPQALDIILTALDTSPKYYTLGDGIYGD